MEVPGLTIHERWTRLRWACSCQGCDEDLVLEACAAARGGLTGVVWVDLTGATIGTNQHGGSRGTSQEGGSAFLIHGVTWEK